MIKFLSIYSYRYLSISVVIFNSPFSFSRVVSNAFLREFTVDSAKEEKKEIKIFVNHKFYFNFPHKFPKNVLPISFYIYTLNFSNVFDRFKFLSWQSEKKRKENKKENENLFNLLFIPRCRGPPTHWHWHFTWWRQVCVLDRQSSNPCHAPTPS